MSKDASPGGKVPPVGLSTRGGRYNGQFRPEFSRLYEDPDLLSITPLPVRYVLGIVGHRWSGKSAAMAILHESLGFEVHSLGDIVRETAEAQGRDPTSRRTRLQLADALRTENLPAAASAEEGDEGDGAYIARRLLRRIHDSHVGHGRQLSPPKRIVLNGFGHPAEIDVFAQLPEFRLIRTQAGEEARKQKANREAEREAEEFGRSFGSFDDAFDAVDEIDLDGSLVNPWAGACAHSTAKVLERVAQLSEVEARDPFGGRKGGQMVFDVQTDGVALDLGERLREIVDGLDRRFRVP